MNQSKQSQENFKRKNPDLGQKKQSPNHLALFFFYHLVSLSLFFM